MVTLANIGGNHWIALILDFKASRILYGDSMGGTIDEGIEEALNWWISQHMGTQFTTSYLPITRQRDGHSCGILVWKALAAYLFPARYSLADGGAVGDERLKMLLRVLDRHNEKVMCGYISKSLILKRNQSFDATAEGYMFTFEAPVSQSSDDEIECLEAQRTPPDSTEASSTCPVTPTSIPATPPSSLQASSLRRTLTPEGSLPTSLPVTPPQASSSKRTLTPEGSPRVDGEKKPRLKKIVSAIRNAFDVAQEAEDLGEESKFGLLKFFSKGKAADKKAYFAREDERAANMHSVNDYDSRQRAMNIKDHKREQGRLRQQKRRRLLKDEEIRGGVRSPRGTKRKVSKNKQ